MRQSSGATLAVFRVLFDENRAPRVALLWFSRFAAAKPEQSEQSMQHELVQKNHMTVEYTSIVGSVASTLTGALGALVGVWLTDRGNNRRLRWQSDIELKKEWNRLNRERGEELYRHADKWQGNIRANSLFWLGAMQSSYSVNDALDMEIARNRDIPYDYGRMEMLVDVYFPTTREAFDGVTAVRDSHSAILSAFKQRYKEGDVDGGVFAARYTNSLHRLDETIGRFKASIADGIRAQ
ncbi:hypothetical protein [Paraburkholderia xenovorans]|uniref:hypothetical protein n=1 Tax=Paraburkholderia xenovorans TaxID=36873 RepID=UPI0038B8060F